MTSRADLPRLGASLSVLGTMLELQGQQAWDVMDGWQHGPRKAPANGERGGGGGEAAAEDRAAEAAQRNRAAKHHQEHRADLAMLDELVQRILRRMDIAIPPNPEEVKNRRTGELDPWTPAEVAIAGYCTSCWRNDQQLVLIYVDPKGMRRWKDSCSWCGPIRAQHKIDPPMELLVKHHAVRNISEAEFDAAITKAKQHGQAKGKKRKGKRKAAA